MAQPNKEVISTGRRRRSQALAYLLCLVVGGALIACWFIGPPAGTLADRERRLRSEMPDVSLKSLARTETYDEIEAALSDSLRMKPLLTEAVNRAGLELFGQSLSAKVTTADPMPEWLKGEAAFKRQLFYTPDFTRPLDVSVEQVREGLTAFAEALAAGGRTGFVIVPPNKSTALLTEPTVYQQALMAGSVEYRQALIDMQAEGLPVVVMTPEEVFGSLPQEPYWTGDTHWKPQAALSLVSAVERELGLPAGQTVDPGAVTTKVTQDLLRFLSVVRKFETQGVGAGGTNVRFDEDITEGRLTSSGFTNLEPSPTGKRAIIIVDSFGDKYPDVLTRLCSLFSSGAVVRWEHLWNAELPPADVVIIERVERECYAGIVGLPTDTWLFTYLRNP